MSLENKPERKRILPILAIVVALGAVGLAAILSGPTISEQVADKKFQEDKNTALYNHSREAYYLGQENAPIPTFATNEELYDFVRAYSQDYSPKH